MAQSQRWRMFKALCQPQSIEDASNGGMTGKWGSHKIHCKRNASEIADTHQWHFGVYILMTETAGVMDTHVGCIPGNKT